MMLPWLVLTWICQQTPGGHIATRQRLEPSSLPIMYAKYISDGTVGGWYLFNTDGNVPLAKAYWSAYQRLGSQRRMMWDVKSWYQARSAPLQFQIGKVICTSGV